jgi:hypothetical protein
MPETEEVVCNNCPPGVTGKAMGLLCSWLLSVLMLCLYVNSFQAGHPWLTPIILDSWEAEIWRIVV